MAFNLLAIKVWQNFDDFCERIATGVMKIETLGRLNDYQPKKDIL